MYPRDKYGSYKVTHKWIEAWSGQAPGFSLNESRSYEDGVNRVFTTALVYVLDYPEIAFAHDVFMKAQGELESLFDKNRHE